MHKFNLGSTIIPAAHMIIEKTPVLCGLAVTEDALGGTHSMKLARPEEFVEVDRKFLNEAWTLLPRIPIEDLDVLVVDEMGKDVSGAGMDPNVIGFWRSVPDEVDKIKLLKGVRISSAASLYASWPFWL